MDNKNELASDSISDASFASAVKHYTHFLESLGYEIENDPNLKDTPRRVTKMMVEDFGNLFRKPPRLTTFENITKYNGMVFEGNIELSSLCGHHFMPFYGRAHVAYIPGDKIIGLSKLNRIVDYFARRPQVQENLTQEIHEFVSKQIEGSIGVAVAIEAVHTCVKCRGIKQSSVMKTNLLSGKFFDQSETRSEFFDAIRELKNETRY